MTSSMAKQRWSFTWLAAFAVIVGGSSVLSPRQQKTFPNNDLACPQAKGLSPLACVDPACVDIPLDGVCHIQTASGFPICGCCPEFDNLACSQCGGVSGGVCAGTGPTGIGYQGCSCSIDDGSYPTDDTSKVCPESNDQPTQLCSNVRCRGDANVPGVCEAKTPVIGRAGETRTFTHCSCCPEGELSDCDDCGGDAGNGECKGLAAQFGAPFKGCPCGGNSRGGIDVPVILPLPIPPVGFPPPPPGTSHPEHECSTASLPRCSDCEGAKGWCQSGENVGCPCQNECKSDDKPACTDEPCKGDDSNKCTKGPDDGCDCEPPEDECPIGNNLLACFECGGADAEGRCNGLSDDTWKGCDCWDDTQQKDPNTAYSLAEFIAAQAALAGVGQMPPPPPESTTSSVEPTSSAIPSPTAPIPAAPIAPSKSDGTFDCAPDVASNGADMADCTWPSGSAVVQGQRLVPESNICTANPDTACISHGQTVDGSGVVLSSWCVVAVYNSCAFVIADKDPRFGGGFAGNSCISGQVLIDKSKQGSDQCRVNNPGTAVAAGPVQDNGVPAQAICLLSKDHPEACAVN